MDISDRHRQEVKDMRAKIQQMKKGVDRNDKKKRKEINTEIEKLEKEMKERHEMELSLSLEKASVADTVDSNNLQESNVSDVGFKYEIRQQSRAQRKREKKIGQQKQLQEEAGKEDLNHLTKAREEENTKLSSIFKARNLTIYEVPADGDCMYKAIEHQLSNQGVNTTVSRLRTDVANFMRSHKEDFFVFIPFETDDFEHEFQVLCDNIEKTNCWGGQLELEALSRLLHRDIEVIQAEGPSIFIGNKSDSMNDDRLLLSYHRHAYSLGEHYNSVLQSS